jgi:hypothetical protein
MTDLIWLKLDHSWNLWILGSMRVSDIRKAIKVNIPSSKNGKDNEYAHTSHHIIHHTASARLLDEASNHKVFLKDCSFQICCRVSYNSAVSLPETKHAHIANKNSAIANHQNPWLTKYKKSDREHNNSPMEIDIFLLYLSEMKPVGISNNTTVIAYIACTTNNSTSHKSYLLKNNKNIHTENKNHLQILIIWSFRIFEESWCHSNIVDIF